MSVKCSIWGDGKWDVFHTGDRHGERGVFVNSDSFEGNAIDCDGYASFEVNNTPVAGDFSVHLPWAVCEAIAKHVADVEARWPPVDAAKQQ